jgi:rhamnulokinase
MKNAACFVAVDLGAESGRCMVGRLQDNVLSIEEVHRFPNSMVRVGMHLYWDIPYLYEQVLQGLRAGGARGKTKVASIGIDTWGIDFGLLDAGGNLLGMPHTYRDTRTDGMMDEFFQRMDRREIYDRTGTQFLPINSLYQLFAMKQKKDPFLDAMHDILFIPDIFVYLLTGVKATEFSYATTSQMYNPIEGRWDARIFDALELPVDIMQKVVVPGTTIGDVCDPRLQGTKIFGVPVIAVATHDTGSAIAALPCTGGPCVFISCGTWSLMGFEASCPMITEYAYESNFTNEGGVSGTFRVLKNITGLWLLQECRKTWSRERTWTYDGLLLEAEKSEAFRTIVDPVHKYLVNPEEMISAIAAYARDSGQPVPETVGQYTRSILEGLAMCYRYTLDEIRILQNVPIPAIHIVGGGSRNALLCQMTANATGIPVVAGPVEATAVGNVLVQAMAAGHIASLDELRAVVRTSFPIKRYSPCDRSTWEEQFQRFKTARKLFGDSKEC